MDLAFFHTWTRHGVRLFDLSIYFVNAYILHMYMRLLYVPTLTVAFHRPGSLKSVGLPVPSALTLRGLPDDMRKIIASEPFKWSKHRSNDYTNSPFGASHVSLSFHYRSTVIDYSIHRLLPEVLAVCDQSAPIVYVQLAPINASMREASLVWAYVLLCLIPSPSFHWVLFTFEM